MPHGKHDEVISALDVIEVVSSPREENAARSWNRGVSMQSPNLR
jgi:hypothetical protein